MVKKKKVKKVKRIIHNCDGNCNDCPNFNTKYCGRYLGDREIERKREERIKAKKKITRK